MSVRPQKDRLIESLRQLSVEALEEFIGRCFSREGSKEAAKSALEAARIGVGSGSVWSAAYLGHAYFNGVGVRKNFKQARRWYAMAAKGGHAHALCWMGYSTRLGVGTSRTSSARAFAFYLAAARKGDVTAFYNTAQSFDSGEGVTMNPSKAVFWWKKAAKHQYPNALCNLAVAYENGKGVRRSFKKAFVLYRAALAAGDGLAGWNLGRCYLHGIGVRINRIKGKTLMRRFKNTQQGVALARAKGEAADESVWKVTASLKTKGRKR